MRTRTTSPVAVRSTSHVLHLEAIVCEDQSSIQIAQAIRDAIERQIYMIELYLSAERGIRHLPTRGSGKFHLAAGDDIGIKSVQNRHAYASGTFYIKLASFLVGRSKELRRARKTRIGIWAGNAQLFERCETIT
jgi:hypothetical protein